ncbi:MAG TPA: hypothetical protein VKB93_00495 [Thermoanaerobaculia bacterium]|nr:hypothetical protein [Thermoanaerobaculia bacterium]
MRKLGWFLAPALSLVALGACVHSREARPLADAAIVRHASAGPLDVAHAEVLLGNDAAYRAKLDAVRAARTSIDAMYFIFADDVSSSAFTQELLAAVKRGVRVRLLLDYHRNYERLDLFTMLEKQARGGPGSLEVRFYNRPTRNIVMDAAYLTIGCGEVGSPGQDTCAAAKSAEIARRFADERIDGKPASELGISNLNVGNSGLFLSGIYAKDPGIIATSVLSGQQIDLSKLKASGGTASPEQKQQLARLARIYFQSRFGSFFRRLTAKLQLAFAFALYGKTLNPIHDTFTTFLPVERQGAAGSMLDWEYVTDFLHHKLLLVDNRSLQIGGRNIEDSYHMRPNPLVGKYIFMDTDVHAELRSGGEQVESTFLALWNYRRMVATTDEVRQHAPNDFVANGAARDAAEKTCGTNEECVEREFQARMLTIEEREAAHLEAMTKNAARYWNEYPFLKVDDPTPPFPLDSGVLAAYIENLPFRHNPGVPPGPRTYGASNARLAVDGKQIHYLWIAGLEDACRVATPQNPRRVVLHQAYFHPSSALIETLGHMTDGTLDCHNVTVTILTNSFETTDLNIVNILARHSIKAFSDYAAVHRDPVRSARFEYYEYLKQHTSAAGNSLHTKVSVLGDDVIVASANADVRSYMMDTNNGLYLRHAPQFLAAYLRYLDTLTGDATLTRNQTQYFVTVPREQLLQEDLAVFRAIMAGAHVERYLDAEQQRDAEAKLIEVLNGIYADTTAILNGDRKRGADFDRRFKPT